MKLFAINYESTTHTGWSVVLADDIDHAKETLLSQPFFETNGQRIKMIKLFVEKIDTGYPREIAGSSWRK